MKEEMASYYKDDYKMDMIDVTERMPVKTAVAVKVKHLSLTSNALSLSQFIIVLFTETDIYGHSGGIP